MEDTKETDIAIYHLKTEVFENFLYIYFLTEGIWLF